MYQQQNPASRKRPVRLDAAQREEVVKMYSEGNSIRVIARFFNASYGAIHRHIKNSGAEFRKRGGANNRRVS